MGLGPSASAPDVKDGMAPGLLAAGWQQSPWVESLMYELRRQDDLADVARLCVLFWPAENLGYLRQVSSRLVRGRRKILAVARRSRKNSSRLGFPTAACPSRLGKRPRCFLRA